MALLLALLVVLVALVAAAAAAAAEATTPMRQVLVGLAVPVTPASLLGKEYSHALRNH
jgi:hypothetical protein